MTAPHNPVVRTQRAGSGRKSFRMECPCNATSPWAHDRASAVLARDMHLWELRLDEEVGA